MKNKILLLVFVVSCFAANSAFAQFSNSSKKKATPTTINKDTTVLPVEQSSAPAVKTVSNNPVVDPNVKPSKIVDTTAVGSFNSKAKKSLRNNYAFATESKSRKAINERVPLTYQSLREEDALFSEFVWEEIDGREKINRPFIYQAYDDNGDQRFFAILLRALQEKFDDGTPKITPFSAEGGDDRFTQPISEEEVNAMLKGSLDTQMVQNANNPNVYDTSVFYNTKLAPSPDSIYTFRLKEQYIFDSKTSRMYCRIIGIAPVASVVVNNKPAKKTLFWLYYPELRSILAKYEVYNPKNISNRITWEELFESRYFNGYVVKSSIDNYNDKMLNVLYKDSKRRLEEGEKIRQKIFDYEQDRWVY
ncbi:MAG: gliding motility protein GldN [Bacteroidota bacterium]|jgi:gliding motility associated protien GldN